VPRPRTHAPAPRDATIRESLREALLEGFATARDLSRRVRIPEHDVAEHLEHLARSLRHRGESLEVEPSACLDCDFVFRRRARLTRPGACPRCRSRRISLPRFAVKRVGQEADSRPADAQ
jgi:predicted Zn-ribbon and HTH transcriptional regulator